MIGAAHVYDDRCEFCLGYVGPGWERDPFGCGCRSCVYCGLPVEYVDAELCEACWAPTECSVAEYPYGGRRVEDVPIGCAVINGRKEPLL